jgi:hypothetical protein
MFKIGGQNPLRAIQKRKYKWYANIMYWKWFATNKVANIYKFFLKTLFTSSNGIMTLIFSFV